MAGFRSRWARRLVLIVVATVAGLLLPACTVGRSSQAPATIDETTTEIVSAAPTSSPSPAATGALDTAPIAATNAASCGLLTTAVAADEVGMRLARIQVLTQQGALVGCRFYALQDSSLSQSEHLPGPNQPALEFTTTKYASATAALAAAVRFADAGTAQQVVTLAGGQQADAFRTTFDPSDGARDWEVVFSKAATLVLVKTAVSDTSLDAVNVANQVYPAIR
jgi:hypothetical protein